MRWLLLFLIVLNAVVLFWFGQQQMTEGQHDAGMPSVSTSHAPGIALLSELPSSKIKYKKAEPEPREEPAPVAVTPALAPEAAMPSGSAAAPSSAAVPPATDSTQSVANQVAQETVTSAKPAAAADKPANDKPVVNKDACGFLGPFAEPITVRQVAGRLKRAQVDVRIYSESTKISPIYWVYLRPAANRSAALVTLRKLHADRIESFIVSEGDDTNAISLGFYKKKGSAETVQQQRIAQGYDARLVKKERQRDQYWVVVQPQGWSRVDTPLVSELRKEYGEFTRRSRKCSVVASLTQFE